MSFIIILALYPLTSGNSWALKFLENPMFLDVSEKSNHKTPKPKGAGIILILLILIFNSCSFIFRRIT